MASPYISIRIAQIIGLSGAAWLSGNIASLSLITIPALQLTHSPQSQIQQPAPTHHTTSLWLHTYNAGKSQNRPISLAIASSFAYLAIKSRTAPRNVVALYGLAAVLTMGIAPFTVAVMGRTNGRLIELATRGEERKKEGEEEERKEVGELLGRWKVLNGVRSLLPFLGGVAGVVAVLA